MEDTQIHYSRDTLVSIGLQYTHFIVFNARPNLAKEDPEREQRMQP